MKKTKILVPLTLERLHPIVYRMAVQQRNQAMADYFIRSVMPDWKSEAPTKPDPWCKHSDRPLNGEASLEYAQGGSKYAQVTPDKRGTVHKAMRLRAVVTVEREEARPARPFLPKGTRRLAGTKGGIILPR